MKIIMLDGYTANPGDVSFAEIEALGELTVYDRTPPEFITERAAGAEILLTNKTPLTAAAIEALPALRYIGLMSTGSNIADIAAARAISATALPILPSPTMPMRLAVSSASGARTKQKSGLAAHSPARTARSWSPA